MTTRIRIPDAIKLIELMLSAKMEPGRRDALERALHDLRLALEDPAARAELHKDPKDRS